MIHVHFPQWLLKLIPNPIKYWLDKRTRAIVAGNEFRRTVIKLLEGLYQIPSKWPKGAGIELKLKSLFPELQTAVETYKPFLSKKKQAEFDAVWVNYFCAFKGRREQVYHHYMNITSSSINTFGGMTSLANDGKAMFIRNIDRLLSFAPSA